MFTTIYCEGWNQYEIRYSKGCTVTWKPDGHLIAYSRFKTSKHKNRSKPDFAWCKAMCTFLSFLGDLPLSFVGYHREITLYIGSYVIIITRNDVISFVVRSDFFCGTIWLCIYGAKWRYKFARIFAPYLSEKEKNAHLTLKNTFIWSYLYLLWATYKQGLLWQILKS